MKDKEKKAEILMGSLKKEPVLSDEEKLFDDIMKSVSESDQSNNNQQSRVVLRVVRNIMKVAAVLLIIIFGYEQFILTNKMLKLENKLSDSRYKPSSGIRTVVLLNFGPADYLSGNMRYNDVRNSDLGSKLRIARTSSFMISNMGNYQINFRTYND